MKNALGVFCDFCLEEIFFIIDSKKAVATKDDRYHICEDCIRTAKIALKSDEAA